MSSSHASSAHPPPGVVPFTQPPLTYFQKCIPQTRTIAHYKRIEQIGEGTYGQVYKALCLSTQRMVALKKIRLTSVATEGLPRTVIREIKILKALRHENMVQMLEVVSSKGCEFLDQEDEHKEDKRKRLKGEQSQVTNSKTTSQLPDRPQSGSRSSYNNNELTASNQTTNNTEKYMGNLFLVLEYISHDLSGILDMGVRFTPVQSKCIFRQLLSVLEYMHEKRYVHRDLKSSNILIDERYHVKLADFGLARSLDDEYAWQLDPPERKFTNKVVTIWYRCPELLLGATDYDEKVDIWSAGCILAELLLGKALFPGTNDLEQLRLIFKLMGTPGEHNWEGIYDFPKIKAKEVEIGEPMKAELRDKYGSDERFTSSPSSLALIERLLELDPKKRWRAKQALGSQYFRAKPQAPADPQELGIIPIKGDSHEFQTKPIRKQAKVVAQRASADAKKRGDDEKEAYETAYKEYLANAAEHGPGQFTIETDTTCSAEPEKDSDSIRDAKKRKREKSQGRHKEEHTDQEKEKTVDVHAPTASSTSRQDASNQERRDRVDNEEGSWRPTSLSLQDETAAHNNAEKDVNSVSQASTEHEKSAMKPGRDDRSRKKDDDKREKDRTRDREHRKDKSRSKHKSAKDYDNDRKSKGKHTREKDEEKHRHKRDRDRSNSRERGVRYENRDRWRDKEPEYNDDWRRHDFGRDGRGPGDKDMGNRYYEPVPHPDWHRHDGFQRRNDRYRS